MIILAAAFGQNGELGKEDGIPLWELPDEYSRFRESIKSHPVIMGRKSFDVIEKPLPGSLNIVITRQTNYDGKGALVVHSLEEAVEAAGVDEISYVIGGGMIFQKAIKIADKMEISRIEGTFPEATAFFPGFSEKNWKLVSAERHEKDDRHAYAFTFEVLERRRSLHS